MAIKNIIAGGIGFSPGSVKFIPTRGFISGEAVADPTVDSDQYARVAFSETVYNRLGETESGYGRPAPPESGYARP